LTPQRFAQRVRDDLRARRWLRWHCSLIGSATLLTATAALIALIGLVTLGAAIDRWMPEARSLPHAVRLLTAV
jgi:hypothetical protein